MRSLPPGRASGRKLSCVIGMLLCSHADAQDPKVRASLAAQGNVWVGQRVTLVVELLAPGFFTSAASFDLPDPSGVLLIPPTDRPVVSSEIVRGVSYTVQRHELSVFARRGGAQTIPSLTARFCFKHQPLDKESVAATVTTEPLRLVTKIPSGAENLGSIVSAKNLTVVETWQPEPDKMKAGDAFTRTITFAAPALPAIAFPPFPATKVDGLGVYPKAPEVLDHSERGDLTGERRDTITYVCQRAGKFVIPPIQFTWFDLESQQLKTIAFPAQTFEVAPNPALASALAPTDAHTWHKQTNVHRGPSRRAAPTGLAALAWRIRGIWQPWIHFLRPLHLAPLNPTDQTDEH